ncbi:glycoside hydrolase family 28 protein [Coprobacter sp.]
MRGYVAVLLIILSSLTGLEAVEISYTLFSDKGKIDVQPFKHYHYAAFDLAAPMHFVLSCSEKIETFEISPKSYGIKGILNDKNELSFTLSRPQYVLVRINDKYRFFLFADAPEIIPQGKRRNVLSLGIDNTGKKNETSSIQKALNTVSETGEILLFPKGIYKINPLYIPSHTRIHLSRGAVLMADTQDITPFKPTDEVETKRFIYFKDVENVKITGYGEINLNGKELRTKYGNDARIRLLFFVKARNINIDGIFIKDPGSWNTQILYSDDISLRHIKMMNDTELSNTDGFDPDASRNVLIENCFAYCSDDNVAIKTTNYAKLLRDVDGITVRKCVFLTKKSSLKVGTETRGEVMKNILFEDNDVIESDRGMALYCSDGARFENIRYIRNRFERNYPDSKQCGIQFVVNKRKPESRIGSIDGVLVEDCVFDCHFPKKSDIKALEGSKGIRVIFNNLVIAGKKCLAAEDARIKIQNSEVQFK